MQVEPSLLKDDVLPLLVFVNKRAGGQQGKAVYRALLPLLNPYQIHDLQQG